MTRPYSWYPLAAGDPVPGDPAAVRRAGESYVAVADDIATSTQTLREMSEPGTMVSVAVTEVRERALDVADDIDRARGRYRAVGEALQAYADALAQAQSDSLVALHHAQAAEAARTDAEADVRRWLVRLDEAEPEDQGAASAALGRARAARDDATGALARARAELEEAVAVRDGAARRAIDAITSTTHHDGLRDSVWENLSDVARWVSNIAGAIAAVAGVLTLVLGWVPVLGQFVAAVALVAGIVTLLADLTLAAAGEGNGWDIAVDILAVATFGLGRLAGTGLKAGRVVMRSAAADRALTVAARSGNPAVAANPGRLIPSALTSAVEAAPIRTFSAWRAETAALDAAIRELPPGTRLLARASDAEYYVERAALAASGRLTNGSTLVADALDAGGWARVLGGTLLGYGAVDGVNGGYGTYQWVHDVVSPPDPLGLT